jgi:3-deoxy-D-manno-octulosonate 8-phosphate phosphatase (KDO 8-P phosphatase)
MRVFSSFLHWLIMCLVGTNSWSQNLRKITVPPWQSIHTIVFDFDGVLTDNKVWVDQEGKESVCCDRGDGLAFNMLRTFIGKNKWELDYFILSKEKNVVVSSRSKKLNIRCVQNVPNKATFLYFYLLDTKKSANGLVYIGNDLNDLPSMKISGFSVAPSDAHPLIRKQANLVLRQKGGAGFVRAFIEILLGIDCMSPYEIIEFYFEDELRGLTR